MTPRSRFNSLIGLLSFGISAVGGTLVEQHEQEETAAARFELLQVGKHTKIRQSSGIQAPRVETGSRENPAANMMDELHDASPETSYMFQMLNQADSSFHVGPALVAAFRLDLFDSIPVDQGATFDEIVHRTNTTAMGMDALLQTMVASGFVKFEDKTGRFYNEFSKHVTSEEAYVRKTRLTGFAVSMQRQLYYLADTIREGRPVGLTSVLGDYPSLYEARADLPEVARDWDPYMDLFDQTQDIESSIKFVYELPSVAARIAEHPEEFSGHVLDWCGNDGKNAIRFAAADPTMNVTVLDLPAQVAKAEENIKAAGLQGQVDTMGADLLDDNLIFPQKYDAVFMIHMEHEWSSESLAGFFNKIFAALKPGGILTLSVTDFKHSVGNFTNYTPSLHDSHNSIYFLEASEQSYPKSSEEVERLLTDAGFVDASHHQNGLQWVAATKP